MLRTSIVVAVAFAAPLAVQAQNTKPDPAQGRKTAETVCAACHGADGNSSTPANPNLAGQHYDYLYKQLANFKVKEGAKQAERANAVMAGFAAMLSEADMRNVSAWYASQKLKPAAAKNKDLVELGQKIYRAGIADKGVPACSGCHSPNGAGMPAASRSSDTRSSMRCCRSDGSLASARAATFDKRDETAGTTSCRTRPTYATSGRVINPPVRTRISGSTYAYPRWARPMYPLDCSRSPGRPSLTGRRSRSCTRSSATGSSSTPAPTWTRAPACGC